MNAKKLIVAGALLLGTTLGTTTATLAQDYYPAPYGYTYYHGYPRPYAYAPYYNYYNYYGHRRGGPGGLGIGLQR
jgi:hypothetical protein